MKAAAQQEQSCCNLQKLLTLILPHQEPQGAMVPLLTGASGWREDKRVRAAVRMGSRAPTFPLEVSKYDDSKLLVMISRMRDVSATEQHEECCRHSPSTKHPRWAALSAESL